MSSIISDNYITSAEAAKILRVTPGRIRQLLSSKTLESEKIGGRNFITRASVMKYAIAPALKGEKKVTKDK